MFFWLSCNDGLVAEPGGALRWRVAGREAGAAGGGMAELRGLPAAEVVDLAVTDCALEVVLEREVMTRGVLLPLSTWPCGSPMVMRVNSLTMPTVVLL